MSLIPRLAALTALTSGVLLAPTPAASDTESRTVDEIAYDTARARTLWQPMEGSPPVEVVELDGRRALRLRCDFAPGRIERGSWDRRIALDMASCRGLQFFFHSRDVTPVGHFTMYFHSGDGWYACSFPGPGGGAWQRVRIDKRSAKIEGTPAGWGEVDTIRLSAWRGRNVDTVFHVAGFALYGTGGKVAVVRGDSAAATHPDEARGIARYADVMSEMLDGCGIEHVVLSDRDLTAPRLEGIEVVALPYSPSMPDEAVEALAGFLRGGGGLIACYVLPGRLQELVGIRLGGHVNQRRRGHFAAIRADEKPLTGAPDEAKQASWNVRELHCEGEAARVAAWWVSDDGTSTKLPAVAVSKSAAVLSHVMLGDDRAAKQRLLLAMLGHLWPRAWSRAAAGRIEAIGRIEPYEDFAAASAGIREAADGDAGAGKALSRGTALRERAIRLREAGKPVEAVKVAIEAASAVLEAHCLVQQPGAGERRLIWCHSAFGVAGMTWQQAARRLADSGFTAVLPNMLWGGVAYYDSDVLPVAPEVARRGDQIAACLAACREAGIECHVWKVNYNMSWRAPAPFARTMAAAGRTQVLFDGSRQERWLCPSHPDNQRLEIDAMVEVARKYPVDGVHFDYIRYPGPQGCFCPGCRKRFEKALGRKVADWPAAVRGDDELRRRWMDFRREQINAVVSAVAAEARKARPGVELSAAVFRDWPAHRDQVGQDWKLWCDRGWLDFVCPMDYTPHNAQFAAWARSQVEWAGRVPCFPGIGLSTWSNPADVPKVIRQVMLAREAGAAGFTIFEYNVPAARDVLPLLGKGLTRPQEK